jgi:hypothetical protein
MLTQAQADWASSFIGIKVEILLSGPAPGMATDQADVRGIDGAAEDTTAGAAVDNITAFPLPIPIPPIPNPVGEITADVTISNKTGFTLTLDTSSGLTSGELKSGTIKPVLKKDDDASFVVRSKDILGVSTTDAEGTIKYIVGDTKAVWTCHFLTTRNPLKPNGADSTLSPEVEGLQKPQATHTTGQNAKHTFLLIGQGGDQPTPSGGTLLSCRVTVMNQTQQTVFLRHQDNAAGGDFVTNPATSLKPGESTNFVYEETANSNNHNCRGTMLWDVGDPKLTEWSMMWDNQRGAKNLSASFLKPDAGFHTLEQIDNGDENVPVTFTLSGGGTGPQPGAKPVVCHITVINQTDQPMKSAGSGGGSGTFESPPPASIAPGAQAQFTFNGATDDPNKGAQGFVQWIVGEKDDAAWLINWTKPGDGASKVDGKVLPDGASFSSSAAAADAQDGTAAMTFTLSGKGGTQPTTSQHFVVAVNNKTDAELQLSGPPKTTGGKLKTNPPDKLAPGTSSQIDFVPDPGAPVSGGTMDWKVGADGKAVWNLTWSAPASGDAHADAVLAPPEAPFSSDAKTIEVDDGAGLVFTLSGKGGGTPEEPDEQFAPPPKSKQPTLRIKDNDPDGWVEYAQRLLNKWVAGLKQPIKGVQKDTVNGDFDQKMKDKVEAFQRDVGCKAIDGVIGNETWSMLREGPHEAVGTDGRKPHSFEQKDAQARFATERTGEAGYRAKEDTYFLFVVSTGEQPIEKFHCTLQITQPDGTTHTHSRPIGGVTSPSGDGQGDFHTVEFKNFKSLFKLGEGVDPLKCMADAYLDKEIGGDRFTRQVTGPDGPQSNPSNTPSA